VKTGSEDFFPQSVSTLMDACRMMYAMIEDNPPSLHILLVENHDDSRQYLAMYLEGSGHLVTPAATVKEALNAAHDGNYDVLLSDIGLPDGDGWQLLQEAHFSHPVYAIAMSGFGMNTDRERSKQAGYRHHVLKPIDIDKLDEILAEAAGELHIGPLTEPITPENTPPH